MKPPARTSGSSPQLDSARRAIQRFRGMSEEQDLPARVVAECSSSALQGNYHAIRDLAQGKALIPMIKANAYGHGAAWAAKQLAYLPDLYGFGVATLDEGSEIRNELGTKGRRVPILVFSGTSPWSDEKGYFCEKHGLTPVISTDSDWKAFAQSSWFEKIPYELKFNSGMNRLGISTSLAASIAKLLKNKTSDFHPSGICSHLAVAEEPDHKLSQLQRQRFEAVRAELASVFPGASFHLGNSSAIWNSKHWRLDGLTDAVRPGISLYGVPPWPSAPTRGLETVMTLKARIAAVHDLKAGDSVGYGATYTVPGKNIGKPGLKKDSDSVRVAVLTAGYADGILRSLSNQGYVWVNGKVSRFVGRVSMDMCSVTCPNQTKVGDWAEVLGPNVDIWAQAKVAGTIPYELLTSVSTRVQRKYV